MINTNDKKAVIYCRVSTKDQVEEGNSLSTQEKNCREYAAKHGYDIAAVFIEQGESAKTANRTELHKLFAYCSNKKNQVSAVIAYKIDRISRNTDDYSQIRILLKQYGVEIKSTSEYFENTPAGKFMENIIANVAQFDNDVRAERCIGGMKEAMREGRYVWRAPAGYKNEKVGGKSTIVPDKQATLVTWVFDQISQNVGTFEQTRYEAINAGLQSQKGKKISKSQFYDLLRNKVYAGWIIKFGEQHKGLFQPLVTQDVFDQVQRILNFRKGQKSVYKLKHADFPLRNLFYQSSGSFLSGCWAQGRRKKYPYYIFRNPNHNYKKEWLENKFEEFLSQFALSNLQLRKFKQHVYNQLIKQRAIETKNKEDDLRLIDELKSKQRQLIDKNLQGVISNEILQRELNSIEEELMKRTALVLKTSDVKVDFEKIFEKCVELLKNPSKIWAEVAYDEKINLQWFYFPEGIMFDGENCRTTEICNLYKDNLNIFDSNSGKVHLLISKSNTPKLGNAQIAYRKNRKRYKNPRPVKQEITYLSDTANKLANDLIHLDKLQKGELVDEEEDVLKRHFKGLEFFDQDRSY